MRASSQPTASQPLEPATSADRRGLSIFLEQTRAFRLALALYDDPLARDAEVRALRSELAAQGVRVLTLDLREPPGDTRTLLTGAAKATRWAAWVMLMLR